MNGFITLKKILAEKPSEKTYYAFVKKSRVSFILAEVHPGQGIAPIMELTLRHPGAVALLFGDLYEQLHKIFGGKVPNMRHH